MTTPVDDLDLGARISLDDQCSEALARIAPAWARTAIAFTTGAQSVAASLNDVGMRVSNFVSRTISTVGGGFGTFGRSVAALTGQSGALSMMLSGPIGIAHAMHGVMSSAMEAGGEMERLQNSFTIMFHSADLARDHLAELQRFAVETPFEFPFLVAASRGLHNVGFQTVEVNRLLHDIGDAATGAGTGTAGFERMLRVMGDVRGMGRMTLGSIRALKDAGLNIPALQQQLGMNDEQFAHIAHANISRERLIAAIQTTMREQFGGAMARAAAQLSNKLTNLVDNLRDVKLAIYAALGPAIIPILDSIATFILANIQKIGETVGLVLTTTIHFVRGVLAPVFGAMSDVMDRANGRTRTSVGGVIQTLQRAALLIEGASALIVGDNGHGVSGISYVLREKLVRAGLWHTAVEIARFANRARSFLVGFTEETVGRFTRTAARVRWLTDALGLTSGRMDTTRMSAQALGARVAWLVGTFLAFRISLRIVGALATAFSISLRIVGALATAFTYLPTVIGAVTGAFRFLRVAMWAFGVSGGPVVWIVAAVAALGLLAYYLVRNASVAAFFRRAWEDVRGVFAPVGVLFARAWGAVKGLAAEAGGALVSAFRQVGAALRPVLEVLAPLWRVLRVVGSFIAVALYVYVVALGAAFYGVARVIGFVLGAAIRGFIFSVRFLVAVVSALSGVWATVFRGLLSVLAPVWSVLRVVGAFVGVVLYVAFLALGALVRWVVVTMLRNFIATFVGVARAVAWLHVRLRGAFAALGGALMWVLRTAFGPLFPYLVGAFNAVASTIGAVFRFLAGHILDPFRMVALALVRVFQSLPAALRPAALAGAINTLTEFGNGGAESPSTEGGVRGAINASRAAPARAANAATSAATAAATAAANAPAVIYNPPPTHVSIQVDRREIARAVQEHQDDDAIRYGDTRGTTPRRPR